MTSYSIYIVDDEAVARNGLKLALKKKNYDVAAFETAEAVLKAIDERAPDLVLLDIGLPGMSGVEALEIIKKCHPEVIVVMITAYEDVPTVVSSMKNGAYEYVVKPVQMDALLVILRNAFETIAMRKEIQILHEKYLKENLPCFIGQSNAIQDVMELGDNSGPLRLECSGSLGANTGSGTGYDNFLIFQRHNVLPVAMNRPYHNLNRKEYPLK